MKAQMSIIIIMAIALMLTVLVGCDAQKAKMEQRSREYMISPEDSAKFAQLQNDQRLEIEKYYDDFGVLPQSLSELEQAGYAKLEPFPKYVWDYKVMQANKRNGFQLSLVPDILGGSQ